MRDRIEREMHVRAPVDRVWQVITDPAYVARWFGDTAQIDLRPGGAAAFGWSGYDPCAGLFHATVERVEPPREFAFRWVRDPGVPAGADVVSTLVEFSLSPAPGGTLLRLVESGFATDAHRAGNDEGWTEELAELVAFAEAGAEPERRAAPGVEPELRAASGAGVEPERRAASGAGVR